MMFSWTRLYVALTLTVGESITLPATASHHLVKVLRHKIGDHVILFNGDGHDYGAVITKVAKKATEVTIQHQNRIQRESPLKIHLGQCLARGERMDLVMQKCVELGVSAITPLFSEYSQVKLSPERAAKRLQHWQGIIESACEQSGRNVLPQLHPPMLLPEWVRQCDEEVKLCLHFPVTKSINESPDQASSVALLVGPEGGLSDLEVSAAKGAGFELVQFGPRVLRAETAGITAVAVAQARWGDLSQLCHE